MKDKKGLSEMIGYVLLIVIAISLSVIVYSWLKNSVWKPQDKCNDGVNLIIENYQCNIIDKEMNLNLRNMGTFSTYGFIIRAANRTGRAIYPLKASGETSRIELDIGKIIFNESMKPDEIKSFTFIYSGIGSIQSMSIEPIEVKNGKILLCEEALINQEIKNCN